MWRRWAGEFELLKVKFAVAEGIALEAEMVAGEVFELGVAEVGARGGFEGFGLDEEGGGLFGGGGVLEGELSELVGGIGGEEFVVVPGEGADIGDEGEAGWAWSNGELHDLTQGVAGEPGVELGAIFGGKAGQTVV
jgi:hypothetical protein